MIKFDERIMKKVEQKEKEEDYIARCLGVSICPKCGDRLSHESFEDGGTEYRCLSDLCDFINTK